MNILRKKTINLLVILSLLICMLASGCSSDKDKKVSKSGFYFDTIICIRIKAFCFSLEKLNSKGVYR